MLLLVNLAAFVLPGRRGRFRVLRAAILHQLGGRAPTSASYVQLGRRAPRAQHHRNAAHLAPSLLREASTCAPRAWAASSKRIVEQPPARSAQAATSVLQGRLPSFRAVVGRIRMRRASRAPASAVHARLARRVLWALINQALACQASLERRHASRCVRFAQRASSRPTRATRHVATALAGLFALRARALRSRARAAHTPIKACWHASAS